MHQHLIYMYYRLSIIDNDHKFDRILESMNLDEYECINLPMEQVDDSSQEHTYIRMAPTLDTESTSGLAPCEGSGVQRYCFRELTLARGFHCLALL